MTVDDEMQDVLPGPDDAEIGSACPMRPGLSTDGDSARHVAVTSCQQASQWSGPTPAPNGRAVILLAAGGDVYVFPAGDDRIDVQTTVLIGANLDVERYTVPEASFDDTVWPQLAREGINVIDCRPGELVGSAALADYTGYGIDCDGVHRTIDGATVGVDGAAELMVGGPVNSGLPPTRLVVRAGTKVRVYGISSTDLPGHANAGVVQS